jgi:hypothetical protein
MTTEAELANGEDSDAQDEQTDYLDDYFVNVADPNLDRLDSARRTWEKHGYLRPNRDNRT